MHEGLLPASLIVMLLLGIAMALLGDYAHQKWQQAKLLKMFGRTFPKQLGINAPEVRREPYLRGRVLPIIRSDRLAGSDGIWQICAPVYYGLPKDLRARSLEECCTIIWLDYDYEYEHHFPRSQPLDNPLALMRVCEITIVDVTIPRRFKRQRFSGWYVPASISPSDVRVGKLPYAEVISYIKSLKRIEQMADFT